MRRCLETVLRDVERQVDIPASIVLPDDPSPQTFVSTALVAALMALLDCIEATTEDEATEDLSRCRFGIMAEHGLELTFHAPGSDEVH